MNLTKIIHEKHLEQKPTLLVAQKISETQYTKLFI